MINSLLLAGMFGLSAALPLVFQGPQDLGEPKGVQITPQLPTASTVLIPADPNHPKLWFAPAAVHQTSTGTYVWYQRVDMDEKEYADRRTLCLGFIRNGKWDVPAVNTDPVPWGGPNNVVMRRSPHEPTWGGFNVFQIVFTGGQFRMVYWDQPEKGEAGALLATSPDGVKWDKDPVGAVFTEHNDAFSLLEKDGEFLLYQTMLEDWPDKPYADNLPGKRRVQSLRTSRDLVHWTPQAVFLRPDAQDAKHTEFYLMKAFRYGKGYLSLLLKYWADPAQPNKHSALVQTELIASDDARTWQRPYRTTDLPFWTYADPFTEGGKLCFVTGRQRGLDLLEYAPRRFMAVACTGDQDGSFVTAPFALTGADLALDVDAREGWVDVELLDTALAPLAGIYPARVANAEGRCVPIEWGGFGSSQLPAGDCRLRLRIHKAKLFAVTTMAERESPGGAAAGSTEEENP